MPYIDLLTAEGVKEEPSKFITIANLTKPTNVKGVRRILGLTS